MKVKERKKLAVKWVKTCSVSKAKIFNCPRKVSSACQVVAQVRSKSKYARCARQKGQVVIRF